MKKIALVLAAGCLLLCVGCGKTAETTGNVNEIAFPSKVENQSVTKYNQILGAVSDESSAVDAVNAFVNYVDSRLKRSGSSVQSLQSLIKPATISKMAREQAGINDGSSVMSDSGPETPRLDIGTVTDTINELGSSEGIRVDDETVTCAKNTAEESMPNINSGSKPGMTALEAAVIGYAIVSGDDGTAAESSVDIPVQKIGNFVEKITN